MGFETLHKPNTTVYEINGEALKRGERQYADLIDSRLQKYSKEAEEKYPEDDEERKKMVLEYVAAYISSTSDAYTGIPDDRKKEISEMVFEMRRFDDSAKAKVEEDPIQ